MDPQKVIRCDQIKTDQLFYCFYKCVWKLAARSVQNGITKNV